MILNFGSLNIDHVYGVDHVVAPGETLAGDSYRVFAGGKGANQSAALALAGAPVAHAGRVGEDGRWLVEGLADLGVDVSHIVVDPEVATGHAVIQVETASAENAIFLYPGTNRCVSHDQIRAVLRSAAKESILLLQNEISGIPEIIEEAANRDMSVCFNPAPFEPQVCDYPLDRVDLLIVNQTEAAGLAASESNPRSGGDPPVDELLACLRERIPEPVDILLTLGAGGAVLDGAGSRRRCDAVSAGPTLDTTAAGDTFIGYFLAARFAGADDATSLRRAAAAAAICVTRPGARDSIPSHREVDSLLEGSEP